MQPFQFHCATRIVFGAGRLAELGKLARQHDASRALVVSDAGILAAGHTQRGIDTLHAAGVETRLFDGVQQNPTSDDVEAGCAVAHEFRPDILIGIGGGSSMDCAKGINFVYTGGGRIADYWGQGKARQPMLPLIAVPTTAGTGSETQSFALISDAQTHIKMACGDPRAACRAALLDPELTVTQPRRVTADTGIDALAHAVESFVTKARTPLSLDLSRSAWRLLAGNFARVLAEPADLDARAAMQLGACQAGMAIENSMLGATHALANPLTAHFGTVHGEAIGLLLPHVIRFNAAACDAQYESLLAAARDVPGIPTVGGGAGLADFVHELAGLARLPRRLAELKVPHDALPELAAEAAQQWTAKFNPRNVGVDELRTIYEAAY